MAFDQNLGTFAEKNACFGMTFPACRDSPKPPADNLSELFLSDDVHC